MKVMGIKDIDKFFEVVDSCKGKVELVTGEGDRLNLKSKLSQYVSLANIFSNGEIPELEIVAYEKEDIDKSSICFTIPHVKGRLSQILSIFSFYDLNLTKIQSLPIPGKEWQYFFYVDLKFEEYNRYQEAMNAVQPLMEDVKIMGEYKSCNG